MGVEIATARLDTGPSQSVVSEHGRSRAIEVPSTFDDFFRAQHASIVRALALALRDESLAADAADEGFTRALTKWATVAGYDNPGGWVYRVGLNWATSRRRRSRRETLVADQVDREATVSSAVAEPGDPALSDALSRLPLEQRTVVVARYYLDLSEAEISTALDLRPGTVKSRLHRALARLATDPDVAGSRTAIAPSDHEETDPA